MRSLTLAALLAGASTVSAQNVTFSFASDTASEQPTFKGTADDGMMRSSRVPIDALVDDANGPLPTLEFDARFYNDFQLEFKSTQLLPSGQYLHTYGIDGTFSLGFNSLLNAEITDGVLTTLGGETSWGTTATIQASSNAGSIVNYTWLGDDEPAYNLFDGLSSTDLTDAAFTLTALKHFDNIGVPIPGVPVNPQTGLPSEDWEAEGSYSGSAFFIPAPASASLLMTAGLVAARRRRS